MTSRVLFITPQLYPDFIGGAEVFNYYLIKELRKYFEVNFLKISSKVPKKRDYEANQIDLNGKRNIFRLFEISWYLLKHSKKHDIVVTSFSRTKWYHVLLYPLIKLVFALDYIIVIHGGGLTPWNWKWPYNLYFKKSKKVIGVSKKICFEYKKRTEIEILHIPPLIPFKLSSLSKNAARENVGIGVCSKVFLFVGSLKQLKRPEVILEALCLLDIEFLETNKILCLFAGDGPMKKDLINFSKNRKLNKFVRFLGNYPRDRMPDLYRLSDYYIISSDYEGTPISLLEAFFNKIPIIASNVSGIKDVVDKNTGILFDNNNPKSLVDGIKRLINDAEFSELMTKTAYQYYLDNFDYDNMLLNYKEILK